MKAVLCRKNGAPELLTIENVPLPEPGPGEIRIKINACGLNFPDLLLIEGKYQDKAELPFIPGGEVSGTVEKVSEGVTGFSVGQTVMATTYMGGLAEYVVTKPDEVYQIPKGLTPQEAAGFSGVFGTSYHALKQRGQLKEGEVLLVMGASGGTGSSAVQIGKSMNAHVIAAVSSEKKAAFAKTIGADDVINYTTENLRDSVLKLTAGRGADVIYDPVGGDMFDNAIRCINWNGRLLVVGFTSGRIPKLTVNRTLLKGCAIIGVYYGQFCKREPQLAAKNAQELSELTASKAVKPQIETIYPMASIAEALSCFSNRTAMGKIIVAIE